MTKCIADEVREDLSWETFFQSFRTSFKCIVEMDACEGMLEAATNSDINLYLYGRRNVFCITENVGES